MIITEKTNNFRKQNVIYYLLGVIEVLLALRLLFKILGANPLNFFVNIIYLLTNILIFPFVGIFRISASAGSVFEPAVVIGMMIYGVIAYGAARLIKL